MVGKLDLLSAGACGVQAEACGLVGAVVEFEVELEVGVGVVQARFLGIYAAFRTEERLVQLLGVMLPLVGEVVKLVRLHLAGSALLLMPRRNRRVPAIVLRSYNFYLLL